MVVLSVMVGGSWRPIRGDTRPRLAIPNADCHRRIFGSGVYWEPLFGLVGVLCVCLSFDKFSLGSRLSEYTE